MTSVDKVKNELMKLSAICSKALYEDSFVGELSEEDTECLIEMAEGIDEIVYYC